MVIEDYNFNIFIHQAFTVTILVGTSTGSFPDGICPFVSPLTPFCPDIFGEPDGLNFGSAGFDDLIESPFSGSCGCNRGWIRAL